MQINTIPISQIKENDWNPNELDEKAFNVLTRNIKDEGVGYTQPIEVREIGKDQYEVIDGAHRLRACKEAGLTEIECVISEYDDTQAKLETLAKNKIRGSINLIKAAKLISELDKGIALEDIEDRTFYGRQELEDTLKLLEVPKDFEMSLKEAAQKEELEAPVTLQFVVSKDQAEIIERAVAILCKEENIKRGRALELICADFLSGA